MSDSEFSTYLFHKPYGVLSQFTQEHPGQQTLADFMQIEKDVYPIGRLDRDSEGLLLLSNNKNIVNSILHPSKEKWKTYWIQVENIPSEVALSKLKNGLTIRINKKEFKTKPAQIQVFKTPPNLPEREPPVRFRANIPTQWLEIKITEGKKRQVRKMLAAINHPVLRLVRIAIDHYKLDDLEVGCYKKL